MSTRRYLHPSLRWITSLRNVRALILENFLQNKKGIKDKLERSFVLLRNGEIRIQYNSADIG